MINRICHWRRERGLTLAELADRAGTTPSTIGKLERGEMRLTVQWMQRLGDGLGISAAELIESGGRDAAVGLVEDAVPYEAEPGDPLAALARAPNRAPYTITSNALENLGINAGDVVIIDVSAKAVDALKPLAAVIVQIYDTERLDAKTVVRQFVPPALLITNMRRGNQPPFSLDTDDVAIKGVIITHHRALTGSWRS